MPKKMKIDKRLTQSGPSVETSRRLAKVRKQILAEFPPAANRQLTSPASGLPAQIRAAREKKQMTWYSVANAAGIPHPSTVRDMELGRDVLVSNVEAVAKVLGMQLELVETN
jgi:hypothetical protein